MIINIKQIIVRIITDIGNQYKLLFPLYQAVSNSSSLVSEQVVEIVKIRDATTATSVVRTLAYQRSVAGDYSRLFNAIKHHQTLWNNKDVLPVRVTSVI